MVNDLETTQRDQNAHEILSQEVSPLLLTVSVPEKSRQSGSKYGFVTITRKQVEDHPEILGNLDERKKELFTSQISQGNMSLFVYVSAVDGASKAILGSVPIIPLEVEYDEQKGKYKIALAETELHRADRIAREQQDKLRQDDDIRRELDRQVDLERKKVQLEKLADVLTPIYKATEECRFNSIEGLRMQRLVTAHPLVENVYIIQVTKTWDNDAEEVSSRRGARSYEVFNSVNYYVLPKEVDYNEVVTPEGVVGRGSDKIKVRIMCTVNTQEGQEINNNFHTGVGSDTHILIKEGLPGDMEITNEYWVTRENAQKIWQHLDWWRTERYDFEEGYWVIQAHLQAIKLWQDQFPDIPPGEFDLLCDKYEISPSDVAEVYLYKHIPSCLNKSWWDHSMWWVPDVFDQDIDVLNQERVSLLKQEALAGNPQSLEIMRNESRLNLLDDLWETFPQAVGQEIHPNYSKNEDFWDTRRFEPGDDFESCDYIAYIMNENGDEVEIGMAQLYQYDPGDRYTKPYYRLYTRKEDLNVPDLYDPGSVKWKKDLIPE